MFTGLVEEEGEVTGLKRKDGALEIEIGCSGVLEDLNIDNSVAVSGCCLTVTGLSEKGFSATAIEETLRKTNLGDLGMGDRVNLERAMKQGDRLGGHIVQGHVDCTAVLLSVSEESTGRNYRFDLPEEGKDLIVPMGSVTLNGISLTVSDLDDTEFQVSIIPYTYEQTNIRDLKPGQRVNVEFDMIGKYIARMIQPYINKLKN